MAIWQRVGGFQVAALYIPGDIDTKADKLSRATEELYTMRALKCTLLNKWKKKFHLHAAVGAVVKDGLWFAYFNDIINKPDRPLLWLRPSHFFIQAAMSAAHASRRAPQYMLVPKLNNAPWWFAFKKARTIATIVPPALRG